MTNTDVLKMARRWSAGWPSVGVFWQLAVSLYTEHCSEVVRTRYDGVRQCSRRAQEVIGGRGYCHPHARRVKP